MFILHTSIIRCIGISCCTSRYKMWIGNVWYLIILNHTCPTCTFNAAYMEWIKTILQTAPGTKITTASYIHIVSWPVTFISNILIWILRVIYSNSKGNANCFIFHCLIFRYIHTFDKTSIAHRMHYYGTLMIGMSTTHYKMHLPRRLSVLPLSLCYETNRMHVYNCDHMFRNGLRFRRY